MHASTLSNSTVGAFFIPVTYKAHELAKRLLALHDASREALVGDEEIGFRTCDKLREPLSSLAGAMGFQALMHRALTLAKASTPRLASAKVGPDGCLGNLSEIEPRLNANEAAEGEVALIGNMVDLLCIFLGPGLALRLIQDVWPDASFDERDDGKETEA